MKEKVKSDKTEMHSNRKLVLDNKSQAKKTYRVNTTHSKAKQTAPVPYLPQSPGSDFISLKYWLFLSNIYSPVFRLI